MSRKVFIVEALTCGSISEVGASVTVSKLLLPEETIIVVESALGSSSSGRHEA